MPRIAYIEEIEHPELAPLIARIKAERGKLLDLYKVLLHSPAVMEGWLNFFTAIRQKTKLGGRYRELAILRVAVINGADYEYRAHLPFALKEGATAEQIAALGFWQVSNLFDTAERAVLAYTDAMTKDIRVSDGLFAEVKQHFDAQELVELTATVAGYNLVSRFLVAMQVHQQG
ncbi:MAG: carboxymuconolactone decarboxylase family protein [Burkholderiales bacterium]|nr:carboxymuconolactone decarboxylase family protein [Burkholderiales bacterium]